MTNKYERSLLNPLAGPSVGVPALVGVPSRKFRVRAFGTVVANTGVLNIQWMPHAALANDVDCVRVTGGTIASDGKILSNSIFSNSNYGDGKKARLVSARLRVYAQEAATNGVLVAAACPYRTVLATSTVEEIVGRVPIDQMVVCDATSEICNMNYIPKSVEERDAWLTDVTVGPISGRAITDTEFPASHVVVWNGVLDQRFMGNAQELQTNVTGTDSVTYKPTVNLNRMPQGYWNGGQLRPVDYSLTAKSAIPLSENGTLQGWDHDGNPTYCLARQIRSNGQKLYYGIFGKELQDTGFSLPAICDDNFTLADLQLDQESTGRSEVEMFNPDDGWLVDAAFTAPQDEDLVGDVPEIGDHWWWYTDSGGSGTARVCRVILRCVPHFGLTFDARYSLKYNFQTTDWAWVLDNPDDCDVQAKLYTISHKCTHVHRAATRTTNISTAMHTNMNTAESGGSWISDDPFTYLSCASQTNSYPIVETSLVDVPVISLRNAFAVEVTANFEVMGAEVVEGASMTPPAGHVMQISARGPAFVESNEKKEQVLDKVDRIVGRLRKAQRLEDAVRQRVQEEGPSLDLLETAAQADAQQRIATKQLAEVTRGRNKGRLMTDFFRARKPR